MAIDTSNGVSRRTVLLAAAAFAPAFAAGRAAAGTLPQAAVAYQDHPKDDKKCANCNLFVEPDGCKTVAGKISPEGYCKLWVKKTA
jgi:hypothetical protein